MSRLEELIAELCPDGVEYVPLSSVCARQKGISITAGQMKERHSLGGEVCVFAGGNTKSFMNVRDLPRNAAIRKPSIIVKSRGNIGFEYYDKPFTHKNELWSYSQKSDNINLKFIYYYLDSHKNEFQLKAKTGKLPQISTPDTDNYRIPQPPLVIQDEIVHILDTFIELTAELTAELTKRKEQYQYYINTLFQFNDDCVEWKPLGELGSFIRGRRFTKDDYVEEGGISAIHYGEIYTNYGTSADKTLSKLKYHMAGKLRYASPSDVIFTDVGETVEDVGKAVAWLGDDKVAIHDHCYAFKHKMNPKFISYYMQTDSFTSEKIKYVVRTKVKTLLIDGFAKIKIPLPYPNNLEKSLNEQTRIVAILDRFDALCNDLTSGLPAEIEARQKQYEYYRDKLLTFKEAV